MKKLARLFLRNLAKRLPAAWEAAQVEVLKSKLASCGQNVTIHMPVCLSEPEHLEVGDCVSIGPFVHMWAKGGIRLGRHVMIGSHTAITTLTHDYTQEYIQGTLLKKQVIIHDDVWIGAHCVIMPGITVGKGAVVGAGAVVTRDIEPYTIVAGVPARVLKRREIITIGKTVSA